MPCEAVAPQTLVKYSTRGKDFACRSKLRANKSRKDEMYHPEFSWIYRKSPPVAPNSTASEDLDLHFQSVAGGTQKCLGWTQKHIEDHLSD